LREEKLVLREISQQEIIATYDDNQHLVLDTANVIFKDKDVAYSLKFLLAVLNSILLNWWYGSQFKGLQVKLNQLSRLPIRRINFNNPAEKSAHDEIVKLVEEMLALQKQHQQADAALEDSRHPLKQRIESLDREIDQRVYALYGLTEAEIKIVGG
jgi:signal transduction histidine kinase